MGAQPLQQVFVCYAELTCMERLRREESAVEVHAIEVLEEFIDHIIERNDSELSYYCLVLQSSNLNESQRDRLVRTILAAGSSDGVDMAYRVLRDSKGLDPASKEALIKHIVASGDRTVCGLLLKSIPALGDWETKIREVLGVLPSWTRK
jgi:hypothetical protein